MEKQNIIPFPFISKPFEPSSPEQTDLFGLVKDSSGKIVFLDIDELTEESLFLIVARNAVSAVIDLRPRPIFRQPNFSHKQVVSYFYNNNIPYSEAALHSTDFVSGQNGKTVHLIHLVARTLGDGLTILIYDVSAKEKGWLDSIKAQLKRDLPNWTELHPSALNRFR